MLQDTVPQKSGSYLESTIRAFPKRLSLYRYRSFRDI